MLTDQEYFWLWSIYLGACLILLLMLWCLLKPLPIRFLRIAIVCLCAFLVILPWRVKDDVDYLAPFPAVWVFSHFFE